MKKYLLQYCVHLFEQMLVLSNRKLNLVKISLPINVAYEEYMFRLL